MEEKNNKTLAEAVGKYPCPKGCGRPFKTNSAAHAHAHHCKYVYSAPDPGEDPGVDPGVDPPGGPAEPGPTIEEEPIQEEPIQETPELNPAELAILNKLGNMAVSQIQDGMAGLQQSIQANIIAGMQEVMPAMVDQAVGVKANEIIEMFSSPGAAAPAGGNGAGTQVATSGPSSGIAGMMGSFNQINALLETPLGQLIQKKLLGGGKPPKGDMNHWRQGSQLAVRMLGANKADPDATATMIKEFTAPYKGKAGNDLWRGMYDTADMFRPVAKSVGEGNPKPAGEEAPPKELDSK